MHASELGERLPNNFSGEALSGLADELLTCDEFAEFPAVLTFLSHICFVISEQWDGPVTTSEAAQIESTFLDPILTCIKAVAENSKGESWRAADALARALASSR